MKIGFLCKENDINSQEFLNEFKLKCKFDFIDLNECERVDYIICFGGDGTTLKAVQYAIKCNAPIISVNTGSLGFLSAYLPSEIDRLLFELQSNTVPFVNKTLLEFKIKDVNYYALNDVIIERNHTRCSETNFYELKIQNKVVQGAVADGIIISTPTGSTAYSLSAGGAILHPSVNAFIATFICSHSMNSRPIVFNDEHLAEISFDKATAPPVVFADGRFVSALEGINCLKIQKSKLSIRIACKQDYYSVLNTKLKNWSNRG